jgi:hypothetical protein
MVGDSYCKCSLLQRFQNVVEIKLLVMILYFYSSPCGSYLIYNTLATEKALSDVTKSHHGLTGWVVEILIAAYSFWFYARVVLVNIPSVVLALVGLVAGFISAVYVLIANLKIRDHIQTKRQDMKYIKI